MAFASWRRDYLSRPIFRWAKTALPGLSATEREALSAGDVWWDAALFTGHPDWRQLLATPAARLTAAEQAFIDGPVQQLCAMLDDWRINWELRDLPPEVWQFLKAERFFGMIIPERFGGLGFSAFAHSEVIRTVSTRSVAAAVTIMVPNSLGPGELLLQFGTEAQQSHWLPRLADGRAIPAFGLTSPEAGSDAAAMTDRGIVCRGRFGDDEVLGIRLNWHKRYITLGPVATVLGLAFKLSDPDGLLGGPAERGITVALVPTDLPGVSIGRRHLAAYQMFQNGPNWGRDVFIPLDHVIGGPEQVGRGWTMLMSALAAGRGISLPSLSAAGAALAARSSGSYARIRQQFGIPIARFEGVQESLARLAGTAYLLDAGRRLTCAGLDQGRKLAVISAIMKSCATYRLRAAVDDAMDIHAGKAVIDGPLNYLGNLHRATPVGITVEGANILTRNLIVFGQGAIRCHPYLLQEMLALEEADQATGLAKFDRVFWRHVGHSLKTLGRAWGRSWTGGLFAPAPSGAGDLALHYRQLGRYAAAFALAADLALLTLGGALKRREMLSARYGDVLAELYLLSAVLKRYEDEGRQAADRPLVDWCLATGLATIEARLDEIYSNLPSRLTAGLLRLVTLPLGRRRRGPSDRLSRACADLLTSASASRERLTSGVYLGQGEDGLALLERAFTLNLEREPIVRRLRQVGETDWRAAAERGLLTAAEAAIMAASATATERVIAVDDFAPEALRPAQPERPAAAATPEAAE